MKDREIPREDDLSKLTLENLTKKEQTLIAALKSVNVSFERGNLVSMRKEKERLRRRSTS